MKGKRVVIMDGSHIVVVKDKEKEKDKENPRPDAIGVLQPIPNFAQILNDINTSLNTRQGIAVVDVGLVCSANIAGKIGLRVVRKVMERLQV